ncbi:hypothetical protein BDF14DRAFT_1424919 [Spinellus fusiger]|nr:hypothetical protein BDF14DRAFT_1424919 [Spinellus fusiger]
MKRTTVMQIMQQGSESYKAKYEQQLEEQSQDYEAQLQELNALYNQTTRTLEQVTSEKDSKTAIVIDLEEFVRQKMKTLDLRDLKISQLEEEIRSLKNQGSGQVREGVLHDVQMAFSAREADWMTQSASMEANFEGILKEYDRLTGSAMEFESTKMKYQRRVDDLTRHVEQLEAVIAEEQIRRLGYADADTPTTTTLRKEFRQMVNTMRLDHQRALEKEAAEKKQLESQLRDMRHEREMALYERVNKGVQTYFVAE